MAIQDTDLILVGDEGEGSYCIQIGTIFRADRMDLWVLVNEGPKSFKCKIRDLEMKEFRNSNGDYRILLVNRGEKSYKVKLEAVIDKYGNYAAPGSTTIAGRNQTWTVPGGVRSISVLAVGAGGAGGAEFLGGSGGGGGALAYKNNIAVKPGEKFTVNGGVGGAGVTALEGGVGNDGSDSYVRSDSKGNYLVFAGGGGGGMGSPYDYGGGINPPPDGWRRPEMVGGIEGGRKPGDIAVPAQTRKYGGRGGNAFEVDAQGGGGAAAGYINNGSSGQNTDGTGAPQSFRGPRGGEANDGTNGTAGGGGGVGLNGSSNTGTFLGAGGSGGGNSSGANGGYYGGGGGGNGADGLTGRSGSGFNGAVRIIWPGDEYGFSQN